MTCSVAAALCNQLMGRSVWSLLRRSAVASAAIIASVALGLHCGGRGPTFALASGSKTYPAKSGLGLWVDPATPAERQTVQSSRGDTWVLVMSDEFNTPGRSFEPGEDHMWTSLDKADGVNGALEVYAHNMTSTACDSNTCYLYIKVEDHELTLRVYNSFAHPPTFQKSSFFYRSAMLQSWNKFCFQGGHLEVRAQLPGAVGAASGNPDLKNDPSTRVAALSYYPTWPGIWMMGNLGRAIFSASTNRMWPFSYNECNDTVFDSSNQRISACDSSPGHGLNQNQGRGAPEIDLLEGGGNAISSSLQVAPGMPEGFRLFQASATYDAAKAGSCVYSAACETPGANSIDVPTAYYETQRGHKSWYQGLKYAANSACAKSKALVQDFATVSASMAEGVTNNSCSLTTCPASLDVNSDLSLIHRRPGGPNATSSANSSSEHWGINSHGACFPVINSYMGAYLCDPDNQDKRCATPRNDSTPESKTMAPFSYQMDAISANWPVQLAAYTDYLVYQLEWVTGPNGYVRWMLDGEPLFEVTQAAMADVPQDKAQSNPVKLLVEEPMSIILNVALSSAWSTTPPNPGQPCRGDGSSATANAICDSFPMYMKIDYVRLYQHVGGGLEDGNLMQLGCDPLSHPTKRWIEDHIDEYQDDDNPVMVVAGRAFCSADSDCTVGGSSKLASMVSGRCVDSRCKCLYPQSWGGPRCTTSLGQIEESSTGASSSSTTAMYGPSMELAVATGALTVLMTLVAVWYSVRTMTVELTAQAAPKLPAPAATLRYRGDSVAMPKDNYSQNFV